MIKAVALSQIVTIKLWVVISTDRQMGNIYYTYTLDIDIDSK